MSSMTSLKKPLMMLRNKKGIDYYTVTVAVVGIFLLSFVVFSLFTKQYALSSGLSIGTEQFKLLKTYSAAEKALLFVDDSAKLAIEQAAYKYGKSGFYYSGSPCGSNGGFNYWANNTISPADDCVPKTNSCYPDEPMMKWTLSTFFYYAFYDFISGFNSASAVKIPFNYEPFAVESVVSRTEIRGISKDAITIEVPNVKYEVKPSFRESIPIDVVANGKEVVANSQLLVRLSEGDTKSKLKDFSGAGKFKWELASYTKKSSSCTYNTGVTCSYDCGDDCTTSCVEWCPDPDPVTGDPVCCKEETNCVDVFCDGTIKTTVAYDEFSSLASATENQKLLVVDESTKKPMFKNLEYDFGLSWIETGSSSDTCS